MRDKSFEDALKEYDIAIKLNPNDPDCHNEKGVAFQRVDVMRKPSRNTI